MPTLRLRRSALAGLASLAVLGSAALALSATPADRASAATPSDSTATSQLAPAVTLTEMSIGSEDRAFWTVHIYLPADPDGPLNTAGTGLGPHGTAERVAKALQDRGFSPRIEAINLPAFADGPARTLGWVVRIGRYDDQASATDVYNQVRAAGFTGQVRWTGGDGDPGSLQHLFVVRVDFTKFRGSVASEIGPTPALNELDHLTDTVPAYGALAGLNTHWFYNNAPAGLYVRDGKVLAGATQGRGGVMLTAGGRQVDVDQYWSTTTLQVGQATMPVDGINRVPGKIANCGGIGGDLPTQHPMHDTTCTDDSELVEFTSEWNNTPSGPGTEVVIGRDGRVSAVNATRGTKVPAGGTTVQGTGELADWLAQHVSVGAKMTVSTRITDSSGQTVPLTATTTIIQTGPTLVRHGAISIDAYDDGIIHGAGAPGADATDQTFTYNWTVRGNPRSAIGIDQQGRLMLVAIDGRQPGWSEGVSIPDEAALMRSLGAVEALNLDGGGSTVMVTDDQGIVNRPSDATGQRWLGNPILVEPRSNS